MSEESGGGANGNVAFVKREGVVPARNTQQHQATHKVVSKKVFTGVRTTAS